MMTTTSGSSEEYAEAGTSRMYPAAWGRPRGDRFSEERASWVREQCARFAGVQALNKLAAKDERLLWTLRRAALMSRR